MALFFWSDNLYNNKVDFDLHPGIHELPFKPVTMVIQHTVLLGLYGKLFHSYQFSSLVRFKTTSLNWISLVMKIDIRGIISHTTLVGMLYYYINSRVWIWGLGRIGPTFWRNIRNVFWFPHPRSVFFKDESGKYTRFEDSFCLAVYIWLIMYELIN